MRKILVSGGGGFIGSNYLRKMIWSQQQPGFLGERFNFVSVDRINANALNSMLLSKDHQFYLADITDAHIMDRIFEFEHPDFVVHLAAEASVDRSLSEPNSFVKSNVLGTQVIINCCIKHKTQRLVYAGTDEYYGQLTDEHQASWTEESPMNPRNPYSASKACGELLIKAAHQTHGLQYNITRSSNNYGTHQLPDKLIPRTIKAILEGTKIPIYGEGKQIRDWTFVGDNCNAIKAIILKGSPNEAYNISANQEFSNLEVVHEVCKVMGAGHDQIEFVKDPRGNGHDFRYSVDASKLKALGWQPQVKFKRDLAEKCVRWYQDNRWFLQL